MGGRRRREGPGFERYEGADWRARLERLTQRSTPATARAIPTRTTRTTKLGRGCSTGCWGRGRARRGNTTARHTTTPTWRSMHSLQSGSGAHTRRRLGDTSTRLATRRRTSLTRSRRSIPPRLHDGPGRDGSSRRWPSMAGRCHDTPSWSTTPTFEDDPLDADPPGRPVNLGDGTCQVRLHTRADRKAPGDEPPARRAPHVERPGEALFVFVLEGTLKMCSVVEAGNPAIDAGSVTLWGWRLPEIEPRADGDLWTRHRSSSPRLNALQRPISSAVRSRSSVTATGSQIGGHDPDAEGDERPQPGGRPCRCVRPARTRRS